MGNLTQKELLQEGFLDTIRKITSPIAKTVAGAAGAAKGIAKVVAPNLSQAIGSDIDKIKSIGKSASDAFTAEKNRQINSTPERFVENELKTKYSSTFDPKSIKIIEVKQDTTVSLDVSKGVNPKKTKNNRFFVYFQARKYYETTGSSIEQVGGATNIKGVATIIKGGDGKFSLVEIKDENGNIISSGSKDQIKNYDRSIAPFLTAIPNPATPKLIDYATAIKRAFNLNQRELRDITNDNSVNTVKDALMIITNKQPDDILDQNDINLIKKVFKDNLLAENSQINLLKQLNLLNDSYNKTYELSKH
jgi:hypothetical protein